MHIRTRANDCHGRTQILIQIHKYLSNEESHCVYCQGVWPWKKTILVPPPKKWVKQIKFCNWNFPTFSHSHWQRSSPCDNETDIEAKHESQRDGCELQNDHRESVNINEKLFCVFYETFSLQNSCFGAFSSIISNWPPAPALCSCNLLLMGKINQYGQPTVLLIAKRSKGVFFYISAINNAGCAMTHDTQRRLDAVALNQGFMIKGQGRQRKNIGWRSSARKGWKKWCCVPTCHGMTCANYCNVYMIYIVYMVRHMPWYWWFGIEWYGMVWHI